MLQTPCNLTTVWKRHRLGLNLYFLKWCETVTSEDMRGSVELVAICGLAKLFLLYQLTSLSIQFLTTGDHLNTFSALA